MSDEFDSGEDLPRDESDEDNFTSAPEPGADATGLNAPGASPDEGENNPAGFGSEADQTTPDTTPEATVIETFLERAFAMQAPVKVQEVRELLRAAIQAALPPGDMKLLESAISEGAGWPASAIAQMTKDERNYLKGFGYVNTFDDAANAYSKRLTQEFEEAVWAADCLYGYQPPLSSNEFESGYFIKFTSDEVKADMLDVFRGMSIAHNETHRREILTRVQARIANEAFFDDAPPGVNLANGFLTWDVTANAPMLLEHGKQHKARCRLDIEYRPGATAPVFLEGLRRTLPDPQKLAALQEATGAILFGVRPKKDPVRRMVVFPGPRNSGKSTLISVLRRMVPDYAIASVPPEDWGERFNRASLEGVLLNVVTELGGRRIIMSDQLKRIVSCEPVSARRPHGPAFDFTPVAWHLFATNELPRVDDRTSAFERRVLAIAFDRSLEDGEIDGDFFNKVAGELPGILNWAAEGVARLVERERFTIPPGHDEAVLTMQFGTDVVEHFARLKVEAMPDNERGVSTVDLRKALVAYAEAHGVDTTGWTDTTGMRQLTGVLKALYGAERRTTTGHPFWKYIRLK